MAARVRLDAVQLHGDERLDDLAPLVRPVIKALAPGADGEIDVASWPDRVTLLLDAHDPRRRGGTGRTTDWSAAASVARSRRALLAGGLTPENVVEAVAEVRPFGIDVSSGVEVSPGVKDHGRIRALFEALHGRTYVRRRDPDARGYFGEFGGRFVPETLVAPIEELERAYMTVRDDPAFRRELSRLLKHYVGRPTPVYEAARLSRELRRRTDLSQARRSHAHRRAQDQ